MAGSLCYNRSILPLLLDLPFEPYFSLGALLHARLAERGQHGVLDLGMKVFHVIGPEYANAFGMLEFEIAKYRRLGRPEIVDWYENRRNAAASRDVLQGKNRSNSGVVGSAGRPGAASRLTAMPSPWR